MNSAKLIEKLKKIGYYIDNAGVLGGGSYGIAILLKNGHVLKITEDYSEARSANRIKGKKLKNVYNVFRVFTFNDFSYNRMYFIEQELLRNVEKYVEKFLYDNFVMDGENAIILIPNSTNTKYMHHRTLRSLILSIFRNNYNDNTDFIVQLDNYNQANENYEKTTREHVINYIRDSRTKKFYLDMINAADELHENNILFDDAHEGNIMMDDKGNYKIIDLGISQSPESNIETLEHKKIKIGELI